LNLRERLDDAIRLNRSGDISPEVRATLFGEIFWVMVGLAIAGLLMTGFMANVNPVGRLLQGLTILLFVAIYILWKRGKTFFASHLTIWGLWAMASLVVLSESGRASHWLVPQVLIVVLSRYVLSGRAAIALGLFTAIFDLLVYSFSLHNVLPPELNELAQGNDWAAITIGFTFLIFVFHLSDRMMRESARATTFTMERYQSLFDKTNDAVFLINTSLTYLDANQQAADLLGYAREELIGKSILDVVPKDEANSVLHNFEKLEKEGSLPLFERTLVRADGSRRIAEVSITVVPTPDGRVHYFQSVIRDITERKRMEEQIRYSLVEMENLAMQDSLTGLLNRRAITDHADAEWHRAQREQKPLCVMIIDLDNLKEVNDSLGHLVGDKAILALTGVIKESLRRYDWAGRWGGDEFLLVLPGTNLVEAQEVGERLRVQYSQSEFAYSVENITQPRVSIGLACYSGRPGDQTTLNQLFGQADKALYQAKQLGKNQISVYRDEDHVSI
jgi:diguanylate cyclase (GGDEF)-like protein/PAS domain S-box-containing protein